jgi:hypothetical protein
MKEAGMKETDMKETDMKEALGAMSTRLIT